MTSPEPSVFTRILDGDLPGRFVYRDDTCAAFLTIEPLRYGHTLLVPLVQVDKWTDLEGDVWSHMNTIAQEIGAAIINAFDSPRCGYIIAGFDVPHAHIHLFPTDKMADYDFAKVIPMEATDPGAMDEAATRLRQHLNTDEDGFRR
ncbi:MAG: HIT family protein [Corynebacterium sp.]|nr:HIT family protein [Corynebacterium sp.]